MKKFIGLIVIIAVLSFVGLPTAKAQVSTLSRYSRTLDTVTNTGLKSMTTLVVKGPRQNVTITTKNILLTGSTLAGVARLWGSLDGTNYSRIRSTHLLGGQVDSLIIDAAHSVYNWVVPNSPYQYYQVQSTGSGTETFTVQGKYVAH